MSILKQFEPYPTIRVRSLRGKARLEYGYPRTFLNLGKAGSGKSALLECHSLRFIEKGKIIDLFGSRDNEGLAWCRVLEKDQILFVTGDSVEIKGKWRQLKVKDLTLKDFDKFNVVLSVSAFYGDLDEEFHGMNEIIYKNLYRRTHWQNPWFIMVREASNFIFARVQITKNQYVAKADFIYLLREARHMGYSLGVDTIRWTSLDKEIRDLSDYVFVKRVGRAGLPSDLKYVYAYIEPASLMNPPPYAFVLVCDRGQIGVGRFDCPHWHKEEKDDMLGELDLRGKIKYGDVPFYGDKSRNWLSDFEHADIILQRVKGLPRDPSRTSMHKISEDKGRSPQTVNRHINNHNEEVRKRGYCIKCRRVVAPYQTSEV